TLARAPGRDEASPGCASHSSGFERRLSRRTFRARALPAQSSYGGGLGGGRRGPLRVNYPGASVARPETICACGSRRSTSGEVRIFDARLPPPTMIVFAEFSSGTPYFSQNGPVSA